jgi:hypothetical protein
MPAAIIPAVASIGGAVIASKGAKSAAKAQTQAADQATAEQRRQYDLTRADQMPWLDTGKWALGQQKNALTGDWSGFYNSPDYAYALEQGMKGLDRSAASRGRLYSGGYGEDLTKFGQGLATQNYGNYMNRLAGLSGSGQTSANALGAFGQSSANQISQNLTNKGDARASGYANQYGAYGSALGGIGNTMNDYFNSKGGWYLGNNPGRG